MTVEHPTPTGGQRLRTRAVPDEGGMSVEISPESEHEPADLSRDLPWWITAILRIGLIPAMLAYLIWLGSSSMLLTINETRDRVIHQDTDLDRVKTMIEHNGALMERNSLELGQIKVLLFRLCAEQAKNEQQRVDCYR